MEYEFRRDIITGNASAQFSYEHQAVGPWLEVEIGQDEKKLAQISQAVERVISRKEQEIVFTGQEYSVTISHSDVIINANASMSSIDEVPEHLVSDELNIDENSRASCGLDDFYTLLLSWADFIKK
ncbi:YacL family protein [Thalassotalea profundi]|uniref:Uncharacterized protein n=1 Tax=Thalassotalea profundi TaxID=2036687 RepID=A0ABQ3IWT8_9GAMM|nr:YacL family protein [Thalassotalea profundi]GHE91739.1 hypothetical protein GCM10011501_21440 [Thalassotalea profundi]